jgi:hypothetical protein
VYVAVNWNQFKDIVVFFEEVEVNLQPTVNRPVCLGARDQFFFLLEIFFRQLRAGLIFRSALSDERTGL